MGGGAQLTAGIPLGNHQPSQQGHRLKGYEKGKGNRGKSVQGCKVPQCGIKRKVGVSPPIEKPALKNMGHQDGMAAAGRDFKSDHGPTKKEVWTGVEEEGRIWSRDLKECLTL